MSTTDDRIVSMHFDNQEFQKKLADTLSSLDKLSESLKLSGAERGIGNVSNAVSHFDMSHMATAIETISSKFTAMGAAGFTVIQSLTQQALGFAENAANKIISPILEGGRQRALNLEQAKFQFEGLGIDVDKAMKSSLDAVKGTAYGLDEAARVAAQFGASGIKAGDQMTAALRGISGAAAMTGRSFSEIGDIFAGSAGSGKVNTMDLEQFATRGLNAAAAIAPILGKTEQQVRDMASHGNLDFKTFAAAMDKAFGQHATEANKTYTGALSNLHAALSRLGASFFTPELENQRKLFNALGPAVDNVTTALKPAFDAFVKISGIHYDNLVKSINGIDFKPITKDIAIVVKDVVASMGIFDSVSKAIKKSFEQIFPEKAGSQLAGFVSDFTKLVKILTPSKETLSEISRIAAGVFSVFDIGWAVIKGVASVLEGLLGNLKGTGNGLLIFGANLGDTLVKLDTMLVKGGEIHKFFNTLSVDVQLPTKYIEELIKQVRDFFNSFSESKDVENVTDRVNDRFNTLANTGTRLTGIWDHLSGTFDKIRQVLSAVGNYMENWLKELGHNLEAALGPSDFNGVVDIINVGLLGGIVALFHKFLNQGFKLDFGEGVFEKLEKALDGVTKTLKAMQTELKAEALEKIAIALGILTASIVVLSLINSDDLAKALTALTVGFGELLGAMTALDKIVGSVGSAAKLSVVAAGLTLVAGAALVMSFAIKNLSGLSWEELARGLTGIAGAITVLVVATKFISSNATDMIAGGIAMIAMSTALRILANAVQAFATMSWGDMAKGLVGVAGGLTAIVLAMQIMPPGAILAAGIGMIGVSTGLRILADAVLAFSKLSWAEMGKGLVGMAGSLILVAAAMNLMPVTTPIIGAGLILVGEGLVVVAKAVADMGSIPFGETAKGLLGIAVVMGILAIALNAMSGALPGAAAVVVVSGALLILVNVIKGLGSLKISELVQGIGAIAAVLAVLGISALLLEPVIPAMFALGAALGLIGGAFTLFGVGAFLTAHAFEALAESGVAGTKALIKAMELLIGALPDLIGALATALVRSAGNFLNAGTTLLKIVAVFLVQLLDTVIKVAPKIAEALVSILTNALRLIRLKFPDILETGIEILTELLLGIKANIGRVTQMGIDIIVEWATTMQNNAKKLVDAGVNILISFLNAIANRTEDIVDAGFNILLKLLKGIDDNVIRITWTVAGMISTFLFALGQSAQSIVDAGAAAVINFISGLGRDTIKVANKGTDVIIAFIKALGSNTLRLADAAAQALVDFLNGLADAIDKYAPQIRDAGWRVAGSIIEGITGGLAGRAMDIIKSVSDLADKAYHAFLHAIHAESPSKLFTNAGEYMAQGVANALDDDSLAENSAVKHAERIVRAFQETLSKTPDLGGLDANPVITPVLDLTKIKEGARGLNALMAVSPIAPEVSTSQARIISTTADLAGTATKESPAPRGDVTFNQVNNSPSALSTNDIYRNTKSQIALAKEELGL